MGEGEAGGGTCLNACITAKVKNSWLQVELQIGGHCQPPQAMKIYDCIAFYCIRARLSIQSSVQTEVSDLSPAATCQIQNHLRNKHVFITIGNS